MHPWLHFKTITRHKLLVMKYCFRIGLYKQGLLHDLSKILRQNFLSDADTIREREVRIMQREKTSVYLLPGCITKVETNITLNIG